MAAQARVPVTTPAGPAVITVDAVPAWIPTAAAVALAVAGIAVFRPTRL